MASPRLIGMTAPSERSLGFGYVDALRRVGAEPLLIRSNWGAEEVTALFPKLDGLLFPGGVDVDPDRYDEVPRPDCKVEIDSELDSVETRLIRMAVEGGKPFLAICRGMQLLNVVQGGTLWQDLQVQRATELNHADKTARHLVTPDRSVQSVLRRAMRTSCREVNTSHHQAVKTLGEGLFATAASPDGIIEGIELKGHPYGVGVQFHPERMIPYHKWVIELFESFTNATYFNRSLW